MVIPLASGEQQQLVMLERQGNLYRESRYDAVRFVPLLSGME